MIPQCFSDPPVPNEFNNISKNIQKMQDIQTVLNDPYDNTKNKNSLSEKKLAISKIKKNRRKHGEEQLLVIYSHEKSEKGHWVARASLDCIDLIEEYFENIKKEKLIKKPHREIQEILGIVPKNGKISSFEIKYKDTGKIGYISAGTMRKHYCEQLLSFYEEHIQPQNMSDFDDPSKEQMTEQDLIQ